MVEDAAHRPDVHSRRVPFLVAGQHLWAHILQSSRLDVGVDLLSHTRYPKICHLVYILANLNVQGPALLQQNVLEFEVPMHNVFEVAIADGTDYLPHNNLGLVFREALFASEVLQQLAALHVLHHHHHFQTLRGIEIEDLHDVGVAERLQVFRLAKYDVDPLSGIYA